VVVTAFTMHVAVSDFFFAGVTHVDDLHIEIQTLTGQRMIAIDHHVIAFDITNGDDLHAAVRARCVKLHAHFEFVDAFGPDVMVVFGAFVSTFQVRCAGDGSFVPAASLARTLNVWAPSDRPE